MSDKQLYTRIASILEQARGQVARTIDTAMVQAYWLVGREIVEVEQAGEQRAGYGDEVIKAALDPLRADFGKGFSIQNLRYMRQFYLVFPSGSALPEIRRTLSGELGDGSIRQTPSGELVGAKRRELFSSALAWSHYVVLMRITARRLGRSTRSRPRASGLRAGSSRHLMPVVRRIARNASVNSGSRSWIR